MSSAPRSNSGQGPSDDARFESLVRWARGGDREAFGELANLCSGDIERLVHLRLWPSVRSKTDTADIAQSTVREALGSIERFEYRGPGSFQAWLRMLAERKLAALYDHYYKAKRRDVRRERSLSPVSPEDGEDIALITESPGPATEAGSNETRAKVQACVERLDEPYRSVVRLSHDGLMATEIAARLGKPPGTIRSLQYHARRRIRDMLEGTDL